MRHRDLSLTPDPLPLLITDHRIVELTREDNSKTVTLDADTKITNICLDHEAKRRDESSRSSIKLTSNGHTGTICTLSPGKVSLWVSLSFR